MRAPGRKDLDPKYPGTILTRNGQIFCVLNGRDYSSAFVNERREPFGRVTVHVQQNGTAHGDLVAFVRRPERVGGGEDERGRCGHGLHGCVQVPQSNGSHHRDRIVGCTSGQGSVGLHVNRHDA